MTDVVTGSCPSCGAANFQTRFCETCGTKLVTGAPSVSSAPLTSLGRLNVATLAGVLLVTLIPMIGVPIAYSVTDYALVGPRIFTFLAVVGTVAVAALAAAEAKPGNARTGALALALVPGVVAAILAAIQPELPSVGWLFGICIFLSWALASGFRGFGYFGLLVGVGVALVGGFLSNLLSGAFVAQDSANYEVNSVAIDVVFALVTAAATVISAIALERVQTTRPAPVPRPFADQPQYAAQPSIPFQGEAGAGYPAPGYYAERTNTLAITSLVLGLLSFTIVAIVLGHVAISQIKRTGERGAGIAIAGTILGYAWLLVVIIIAIVGASTAASLLAHPYQY